jgi:uncharacterized protein (DUF486 family)
MLPILLLVGSNVFMTFAWYGHLRHNLHSRLWAVVLVSWGIAFFEYCLQVPANRLGKVMGYSLWELKTAQEVITLVVFCAFAMIYMGERLRWNVVLGFVFIALGAAFVFEPWRSPAATPAVNPAVARSTATPE